MQVMTEMQPAESKSPEIRAYFVSYTISSPFGVGNCYISTDQPLNRSIIEDWSRQLSEAHGHVVIANIVRLDTP